MLRPPGGFRHSRQYFHELPNGAISGMGRIGLMPCQPRPLYLQGAVDLGAVEHELEVAQAAQGSLPRHVFCLFDQEEGVVQRQGDRDNVGTEGQTEGLK